MLKFFAKFICASVYVRVHGAIHKPKSLWINCCCHIDDAEFGLGIYGCCIVLGEVVFEHSTLLSEHTSGNVCCLNIFLPPIRGLILYDVKRAEGLIENNVKLFFWGGGGR